MASGRVTAERPEAHSTGAALPAAARARLMAKLGARNVAGLTLLNSHEVNPYHLLDAKQVLISEAAAKRLSEGLA